MPRRSSGLGFWAHRTDLHRDQDEVLGNKESRVQARKLDSQAGGRRGEAQVVLELTSVFCRPAREAGKTVGLAGWKLAGRAKPQYLAR